jgi:hypothetical protein
MHRAMTAVAAEMAAVVIAAVGLGWPLDSRIASTMHVCRLLLLCLSVSLTVSLPAAGG